MDYAMTEAKNPLDAAKCKQVAEYLTATYPGHSWYVEINDGMLIIKSMKISPNAGMMIRLRALDSDAEKLKREVIMKAGEFLEASHLRRGAFQGENAKIVEGLPKGQRAKLMPQPAPYRPEIIVDV